MESGQLRLVFRFNTSTVKVTDDALRERKMVKVKKESRRTTQMSPTKIELNVVKRVRQ